MASGVQVSISGPDTKHYDTAERRECRETFIKHAVECLTKGRATSTCVQRHQVREAWDKFEKSGEAKRSFNDEEVIKIIEEIEDWELFHDSQTKEKKPSDLRVCYLAGENPLNELNVFIKNGILSQNICAIVKNSEAIEKVWEVAMECRSARKVQLFKGNFLECMQETEGQFDIIYFDSPLSLPSKLGTLKEAIGSVFLYNKLASPGALITTFSFPPEETEDNLKLAREYLKSRLKNTTGQPPDLDSMTDEKNYSDYITYQVIDTAYKCIPTLRTLSSEAKNLDPSSEPALNAIFQVWTKSQGNPCFKAWQIPHDVDTATNIPNDLLKMVSFLRYGRIAHPSYIVPEKLLPPLEHHSREGPMFSNVFIFDNCQYVFQQFPSVDYEFSEAQQQNFWVIQTITKCLTNKLAFFYKDIFEDCGESSTSYKPLGTPKRERTNSLPPIAQYGFDKHQHHGHAKSQVTNSYDKPMKNPKIISEKVIYKTFFG